MPKFKTAYDYEIEIREDYPPKNEKEADSLNNKVSKWADRLSYTVFQAQQEHIREDELGWTEEDLNKEDESNWSIRPMLLKSDSGLQQVGDYQTYYHSQSCSGYVGILIERKGGKKGPEDLYSTLINPDNCDRFYREIETFRQDDRFSQMIVIADCSFEQYLLYNPPFNGKRRNTDHIGASVGSRRGKIASLYVRGVPVLFCGTRLNAIKTYKALVRQWMIKHFEEVLGLKKEPYNDLKTLLERKAFLEASLESVNASILQAQKVEVLL